MSFEHPDIQMLRAIVSKPNRIFLIIVLPESQTVSSLHYHRQLNTKLYVYYMFFLSLILSLRDIKVIPFLLY